LTETTLAVLEGKITIVGSGDEPRESGEPALGWFGLVMDARHPD
jgi:hypothetical protein